MGQLSEGRMSDLAFYKFIEGLKKVTRFRPFERLHENVAGHCFSALMLAYDILGRYDLNLNKTRALELLLFHDIPEIGMQFDITAPESASSSEIKKRKSELEAEIVEKSSKMFNRPNIKTFYDEFEAKQTREALFANLIDKLDASIHILTNKCSDFACDEDFEFILHYTDKFIIHFPQLKDLDAKIKSEINDIYEDFKKRKC